MLPIKQYILGEYFLKREHEFMFVFSKYPKTKKKMKNMLIKGEFPPPKPIFKRGIPPPKLSKRGNSPNKILKGDIPPEKGGCGSIDFVNFLLAF